MRRGGGDRLGGVQSVRVHAVVFTAVNTMLAAIWLVTGGPGSPFWPIWPIIGWGSGLMIHGGIAGALSIPSRRRHLASRETSALEYPAVPDDEWPALASAGSEQRWVVVMFVDIVGSTELNDRLGDSEWHKILVGHREMVRACVRESNGAEVGTAGDGCLARFDSPTEAASCAVAIQREIAARESGGRFAPQVRIGIHAGDAIHADRDLLGNVVNLASRVADQAAAAEILVTEPVADALLGSLPVEDRGLHALKGLSRPRHLLAVEWATDVDGFAR